MNVLLIATLNVKVVGNQALRNCLLGLAEAGHKVTVLHIRGESAQQEMVSLHPNVSVEHHSIIPKLPRRIILKIYGAFRAVERDWLRRGSNNSANRPVNYETTLPVGHMPGAPEYISQVVIGKFHWFIFQLKAFWYGSRLLRSEQFDIVYGYEAWGAPAASFLGKIFDRPIVTRFQGTAILGPALESKLRRFEFFDRVIAVRSPADLVIMTNDGTRGDQVLAYYGIPSSRVLFVTNGVAAHGTSTHQENGHLRQELGIPDRAVILLTVCNLVLMKRVDRAIRALSSLISNGQTQIRLVVVGDGSESSKLKQLADDLAVAKYVLFVGAVPHSKVKNYYDMADIFISTYDVSNRGNPVFEALSSGTCVVTLGDGSVDDLVVEGTSGVLIDPTRIDEELPAALLRLIEDPDLRVQLGHGAGKIASVELTTWEERNRMEVQRIESLLTKQS